jgi:UDP-N-acetylglucosamine 2-epimerase (non-hydrolysing)
VKIAVVFGTRPEIIKLAPVILTLKKKPRLFETVLLATAQHRGLLDQMLGLFGLKPDIDLDIMRPDQGLEELTSKVINETGAAFLRIRPDLVVVQGDTTTAMVSALAAFYRRIPVAHVEAGLRTGDSSNPFPEETNRKILSVLASYHFAPTLSAARNLRSEGIPSSRIFVTGNTVVDALLHLDKTTGGRALPFAIDSGKKLLLVTAHRRESFGKPLDRICRALIEIVSRKPDVEIAYPVHPNPCVRESAVSLLSGIERIHLLKPLGYVDFLALMKKSYFILTDSGGVQEEAPAFRKPVLVLREKTERPEGIRAGTAKLVGTEEKKIVDGALKILSDPREYRRMACRRNPYGDGKAAGRIRKIIESMGP